ncbi:hypothetical protein Bca52824_086127 [Brassica carinata]|uniref:Uncharacterized protein n=1 Tax=Brassica carinata TaxID=52824 RepID=A0A8X7P5P3_BRACI|nr:hypothetical protein Bca52824_086127 [Brassica carinata]
MTATECLGAVPVGKDSVSYGHTSTHSNALTLPDRRSSDIKTSEETHGNRRLASTIVTPSRIDRKDSVSYGHTSTHSNALTLPDRRSSDIKTSEETHGNRRLASTIVTPSRIDREREENVTKRPKRDGGLMDCDVQNDDLMGLELAEMEEKTAHTKSAGRAPRGSKYGSKMSAPLGEIKTSSSQVEETKIWVIQK